MFIVVDVPRVFGPPEPMSMTVVIGVVVACLALLVLVTLVVLYTFKTEKWCFAREYR